MLPEQLVKRIISELLDVDESLLIAGRRFEELEDWDSVTALRVMLYLERELGHPVDFNRFMAAECLGDLWQEARDPALAP